MQGLAQNRNQFYILVLVNAFVGSMVGLERSVMPDFASHKFAIDGHSALLSFVAAFGIAKAFSNLALGWVIKWYNRKILLVAGWVFALPVPFLLMYSETWNGILLANVLLGINQGLAWSAAVIMKVDLAGSRQRGLAMGINEFAGYLSVGFGSYLSSRIAASYGFEYFPFIPGILFSVAGLLISWLAVRDTSAFMDFESRDSEIKLLNRPFRELSGIHRNMGTVSITGLVNNFNDAAIWGLLPVILASRGLSISDIGIITGIYPVVWGSLQLLTGRMGDLYSKKRIITAGMLVQGAAFIMLALADGFGVMASASAMLGLGTALVYPNFLTVIAENSHPSQRGFTLSVFRFWRDIGYVIGALAIGIISDRFGILPAMIITGLLTAFSGLLAHFRMT